MALTTAHTSATPHQNRHSVVTGEQQVHRSRFSALRRNWFSQFHFHFSRHSSHVSAVKKPAPQCVHFSDWHSIHTLLHRAPDMAFAGHTGTSRIMNWVSRPRSSAVLRERRTFHKVVRWHFSCATDKVWIVLCQISVGFWDLPKFIKINWFLTGLLNRGAKCPLDTRTNQLPLCMCWVLSASLQHYGRLCFHAF